MLQPVNWTERRSRDFVLYFAPSDARTKRQLTAALLELLRQLALHVLPLHDGSDWDHIRIVLDAVNGKVSVFPAAHANRRLERGACILYFQALTETPLQRTTSEERRYARALFQAWGAGVSPAPEGHAISVVAFNHNEEHVLESEWLPAECFKASRFT